MEQVIYENSPLLKSLLLNDKVSKQIKENEGVILDETTKYLKKTYIELKDYISENIEDFIGEDFEDTCDNVRNYVCWKICEEIEYIDVSE